MQQCHLFWHHDLCSHESSVCNVLAIELVDESPMGTIDHLSILDTNGAYRNLTILILNENKNKFTNSVQQKLFSRCFLLNLKRKLIKTPINYFIFGHSINKFVNEWLKHTFFYKSYHHRCTISFTHAQHAKFLNRSADFSIS